MPLKKLFETAVFLSETIADKLPANVFSAIGKG